MTNAEKFKEVFGIEPAPGSGVICKDRNCYDCDQLRFSECKSTRWWRTEFKEIIMTSEEALEVLEVFLDKQCDLGRTKSAYDANTVWEAVNMATDSIKALLGFREKVKELDKYHFLDHDDLIEQHKVLEMISQYIEEIEHEKE